jgi:GT2 family glycosyltransferase
VGCAAGRLGETLRGQKTSDSEGRLPPREVWGIELNPAIAAEAKARLNRVLVGDVEQMDPLPLPDCYFDCAICGDVLEHLKDPQAFLARLRKHLTPDAVLVANVPNVAHWSIIVQLLQGRFTYDDNGLLDRTHLRFFTPESLKDMLWDAGYLVAGEESLHMGQLYDELGNASPGDPPASIGKAAAAIGLDARLAEHSTSIYQQLYVANPIPDPYSQPGRMATLVGPHIGELGAATKRCSVVVLTYNSMRTIKTCLNSALPTLGADDELILVDNASNDGTEHWLKCFVQGSADGHSAIEMVINESNTGFSRGCNLGVLASHGEYIIMLNPDTRVYPGWIEGLLEPFKDERVAATGPLSDNVCGEQFAGLYLPPGQMASREATARAVNGDNRQPATTNTKLLIGFCLAVRRSVLDQFGLLEERCYLGADDLEISWRLRALGYKLAVAKSVFVGHDCGGSFGTISSEAKRNAVSESDCALIEKLKNYYGTSKIPTSIQLWNNPIFDEALSRSTL